MKRNAFVAMAMVAAALTAVADRMNILVGCNDDWKVMQDLLLRQGAYLG